MKTKHYKTNLRCESCLAKLKPVLDSAPEVDNWAVDLASPDKVLSVSSDSLASDRVGALVERAGFKVLGEVARPEPVAASDEKPTSFYPLLLVLGFLLGGVAVLQMRAEAWSGMRAMSDFMGLFFVVFAFFKLLDLSGFAMAYSSYDILAKRWMGWGYVYPFVELALGVAYLVHWQPFATNVATLIVTLIGSVGVAQTLLARQKIRCACLGTGFYLPMSWVSLTEDVGMAVMAAIMLLSGRM
jgi:hypothetical protein